VVKFFYKLEQNKMKTLLLIFLCWLGALVAEEVYPVVILGSGVSGLTAAVYLGRSNIPPLVITGNGVGGLLLQSHRIHNWPAEEEISGREIIDKLESQAKKQGAHFLHDEVIAVDFSVTPLKIQTRKHTLYAHTCIIAMGEKPLLLGVPGEQELLGRTIFFCALCDGPFFTGKAVAVAGAGDRARSQVDFLSSIAAHVTHITTPIQEAKEEGVLLASGEFLSIDALFLSLGSTPNTRLFQHQLALSPSGHISLTSHQHTSHPAVFAAGDITDTPFKQAVCAAGDGAKAAIQAREKLSSLSYSSPPFPEERFIEITSEEQFDQEIQSCTTPLLVKFYSKGCHSCEELNPLLESISEVKVLSIEKQTQPTLCKRYQIIGAPTLLVLDSAGNLLQKKVGKSIAPFLKSSLFQEIVINK
jgi:thioredoxin reductase (NADPH)